MPLQTHIRSPLSLVGCTNIPLASGEGSGERTILFFGFWSQAKSRSARLDPPELIGSGRWGAQPRGGHYLGSSVRSRRHVFPEGDQQLSGQGNDQYLPDSAAIELDPLMEPLCQYRTWLMPHPQPGKLDHRCSQPRVPGFGDALFVSDRSALSRCRSQTRISSDRVIGKLRYSLPTTDTGNSDGTPKLAQHRPRRGVPSFRG
jgi:hypothetical protein